MNTQEIEKPYIEHAADFRELMELPRETDAIGSVGDEAICYSVKHAAWFSVKDSMPGTFTMSVCVAVAAMTEAWRERLERKHGLYFYRERNNPRISPLRWLAESKQHGNVILAGADSLPELIVAAVKALADEKRKAKAVTCPSSLMGDFSIGPNEAMERHIRQIVREEIDKATGQKAAGK